MLKVKLQLSNTPTLKKLTENLVNTHLNQMNDVFELLHKEEVKQHVDHYKTVYSQLMKLDVLRFYEFEHETPPIADTMAEFYEEMKSTFLSKIDLKSIFLLKYRGLNGIVTQSMLDLINNNQKETVNYKKINRILKVLMNKEDLSMFCDKTVVDGVLILKYKEDFTYCKGIDCKCNKIDNEIGNIESSGTKSINSGINSSERSSTVPGANVEISRSSEVKTYKFELKGHFDNPTWKMIYPTEIFLPLSQLYSFIQKRAQIDHQMDIFNIFNEFVISETDGVLPFLDFTISFWGCTLRISVNECELKYQNEQFRGDLNVCFYERILTGLIRKEFYRRWAYLGIHCEMELKIGKGLYFHVFESDETKSGTNEINSPESNFDAQFESKSDTGSTLGERFEAGLSLKDKSNSDSRNLKESHLFVTQEDFYDFLNKFQTKQFHAQISNILSNYTFPSLQNFNTQIFGENNVMIRNGSDFLVVSDRLFIGRNVKYGFMRCNEVYVSGDLLFSADYEFGKSFERSSSSSQSGLNNYRNDENSRDNSAKSSYSSSIHSSSNCSGQVPIELVSDLNLLFLANDLILSKNIHFMICEDKLTFKMNIESFTYKIRVESDGAGKYSAVVVQGECDLQDMENISSANSEIKNLSYRKNQIEHIDNLENITYLNNFLIFLTAKYKLSKNGTEIFADQKFNDLPETMDTQKKSFWFKFFNLQICLTYDRTISFYCKNNLLTNLINESIDKNTIFLDLTSYLNAIKELIKVNIKPVLFSSDYIVFWYGKNVIFKYSKKKYVLNSGQDLESMAIKVKIMEIEWKLNKINKKIVKYRENAADQSETGDISKEIAKERQIYVTDLGRFELKRDGRSIRLKFLNCNLSENEQNVLEKLFYNIFNYEKEYRKYLEVLLDINKAKNVILSITKK